MKKVSISNSILIKGERNFNGKNKLINYYIYVPEQQEPIYAFSRRYTYSTYEICKSWIAVNRLLVIKSRDESVMNLVQYTKIFLPYFVDEYQVCTVS